MTQPTADSAVLFSPARIAEVAEDTMVHKALNDPGRMWLLSLLGGGFIALGFVFYATALTGAGALPWGLSRLVGGIVFATGLFLVVVTGAELFTSTTMTFIAKAAGRITWWQLVRHWALVYVGNFVGALTIVALAFVGGLHHNGGQQWGKVVLDAAAAKLHHGPVEAFALGIFCNLCVCVAIWIGFAGRSVTDKAVAVVGPVALFVATGMEHSVANMFLIPFAIVAKHLGGADFTGTLDMARYHDVEVLPFLLGNLLPVTLGNIVGGGLMIGLMNWIIHRWHRKDDAAH